MKTVVLYRQSTVIPFDHREGSSLTHGDDHGGDEASLMGDHQGLIGRHAFMEESTSSSEDRAMALGQYTVIEERSVTPSTTNRPESDFHLGSQFWLRVSQVSEKKTGPPAPLSANEDIRDFSQQVEGGGYEPLQEGRSVNWL
jgi:hypothetical protein